MSQVKAGGAYVELTARSAQFLKGLEAAQKRVQSFGASTRMIGTNLMGLGVPAAAPVAGSVAVYANFDDAIRAAGAVAGATGAAVAVSGGIGFMRIVVPHLLRQGQGLDHRRLIPNAPLLDAALLALADVISRSIVAPAELPIGIVTALIGAPFFLYLLLRGRG